MSSDTYNHKDITKWSNDDVIRWLHALNLISDCTNSFTSNHINGYDLINITPEQLKSELSVAKIHDQNVILRNIKLEMLALCKQFILIFN